MIKFFALAFGMTWLCWLPAGLVAGGADSRIGGLLLGAGSAGPLLATLICLVPRAQLAARARWQRRLTGIGGLASPAGVFSILLPFLIAQWALDSYAVTGGIRLPPPAAADAIGLLGPTLIFSALPEELAWRGYALPEMLRGREPLAPTLLLAAAWGVWQVPLFFISGTWQAGIGLGSGAAFFYFAALAGQSVLMSSFYLATRCTWAAVLFHWLTGFIGEAWQLPAFAEVHRSLWTLLAAGIALLLRPPFGIRAAGQAETGQPG